MANEQNSPKNTNNDEEQHSKPARNENPFSEPEEYSNEANHKGAVDLGTDGTKATASQQQGQGAWDSKNNNNNRNGSRNSGNGQGGGNATGK